MASGNMNDLRERIVVEVDGDRANAVFNALAASATKTDRAIDGMGKTLDRVDKRLKDAGDSAEKAGNRFNLLQQSLFGVRGKAAFIWDLAIDGFRTAMGFAEAFIERTSAVQRTMSLLATIPGANAGSEFEYLTKVANNYGISLRAIQDDYAKLHLAAQNTSMSSDQVRRVFEQVSMATRTLHLNQQQTQLTFLAVEQMLSKGKISFEELRKQFAERIPGAMQALAKELGVTDRALIDFITKVGASSEKIVPVLGNAVQRLFQDGIQNASRALDAELNRIKTSIDVFFRQVVDAGGTEGMSNLLKSINDLMQTETIANVFATAMNKITNNIAMFLRTLKPEDIERFAGTVLDFLSAFATLAMAAGRAVVFLAGNLPAVATAFGAFMGATAGAPLGPWGAAIGMISGGIGGYAIGRGVSGSAMAPSDFQKMQNSYEMLDRKVKEHERIVQSYDQNPRASSMSELLNIRVPKAVAQARLDDAKRIRHEAWLRMDKYAGQMAVDQIPREIELPDLPALPKLETDYKKALDLLKKNFGFDGGTTKKTSEQKAAERLITRQNNFIEDLAAQVARIKNPEEDRFERIVTNAEQLGIKPGHKQYGQLMEYVNFLQADYNRKKQEESDAKTLQTEEAFSSLMDQAGADMFRFNERYDIGNLKQVDDSDWATKARKMANQLDQELNEIRKRWDKFARENPLFNFGFDREQRLKEMREAGDAFIEEFKRIEAERRTIQGGAKEFLKEYTDNATNYGQQTKEFLRGVSMNSEEMLFQLVKTGEFSFRKLAEFIIDYMIKMAIAKAMTPVMEQSSGFFTKMLGFILPAFTGGGGVPPNPFFGGARASGGPVNAGMTYLVGERGPELFTPGNHGYVHPNESMHSGGDNYVSVEVNVTGGGQSETNSHSGHAQLGRRIGDAVRSIIVEERRPGGLLT